MKKGYKEYRVASIFLLVIFAALLFSCEKNNKTSEELPVLPRSEASLAEQNITLYVMTDYGIIQRPYPLSGRSLLGILGITKTYMGYFGEKKAQDVVYIKPENLDKIESKYRENIFNVLRSIFSSDRIRDLEVIFSLDLTNLKKIDGEIYVKPNTCGRIVSVIIDGTWKVKYDEKNKPIISPDGSIEREYIPLPENERRAAEELIQYTIDHRNNSMDSVIVQNIPFDRTKQFAAEDAAYFKRQKIGTILFILVGMVIIGSIISFLFSIRHYKRKRGLNRVADRYDLFSGRE